MGKDEERLAGTRKSEGHMNENERRNVEINSIMKAVAPKEEKKEEKKPEKKQAKKAEAK